MYALDQNICFRWAGLHSFFVVLFGNAFPICTCLQKFEWFWTWAILQLVRFPCISIWYALVHFLCYFRISLNRLSSIQWLFSTFVVRDARRILVGGVNQILVPELRCVQRVRVCRFCTGYCKRTRNFRWMSTHRKITAPSRSKRATTRSSTTVALKWSPEKNTAHREYSNHRQWHPTSGTIPSKR